MLITYPHQMLSLRCGEVSEFDDALTTMVDRLHIVRASCTIIGASAVALAGPQIGFPLRMFVWIDDEGQNHSIINPTLVHAEGTQYGIEGCLSLLGPFDQVTRRWRAGLELQVQRPAHVVVRGQSVTGEGMEIEAHELMARVLMHEMDHLDGKLILDRVSRPMAKQALKQWAKSSAPMRRPLHASDLSGVH